MEEGQEITEKWLPGRRGVAAVDASDVSVPVGSSLAHAERLLILATLARFNHHKEKTAAVLGISSKTLYNKLKEYGVEK
jgi:DNA-binding NtrC family response regulator